MKFKTYTSELADCLNLLFNQNQSCFSYGTIEGVYMEKQEVFEILMIMNSKPHNGHFKKFMQFISDYCRRENKKLAFLEVWNTGFRERLLKDGYTLYPHNGLVKEF